MQKKKSVLKDSLVRSLISLSSHSMRELTCRRRRLLCTGNVATAGLTISNITPTPDAKKDMSNVHCLTNDYALLVSLSIRFYIDFV